MIKTSGMLLGFAVVVISLTFAGCSDKKAGNEMTPEATSETPEAAEETPMAPAEGEKGAAAETPEGEEGTAAETPEGEEGTAAETPEGGEEK